MHWWKYLRMSGFMFLKIFFFFQVLKLLLLLFVVLIIVFCCCGCSGFIQYLLAWSIRKYVFPCDYSSIGQRCVELIFFCFFYFFDFHSVKGSEIMFSITSQQIISRKWRSISKNLWECVYMFVAETNVWMCGKFKIKAENHWQPSSFSYGGWVGFLFFCLSFQDFVRALLLVSEDKKEEEALNAF